MMAKSLALALDFMSLALDLAVQHQYGGYDSVSAPPNCVLRLLLAFNKGL